MDSVSTDDAGDDVDDDVDVDDVDGDEVDWWRSVTAPPPPTHPPYDVANDDDSARGVTGN